MNEQVAIASLKKIWAGDRLDRHRDAETIRNFSIGHLELRRNAGLTPTFVLNLDSDWGSGKSFFLTRFRRHLQARGHVAVYVNAWEDDHSDDPFLTVVDAIQGELEDTMKSLGNGADVAEKFRPLGRATLKVVGGGVKAGAKHWLSKKIGEESVEIFGTLVSGDAGGDKVNEASVGDLTKDTINKAVESAVKSAGAEIFSNFKIQKEAQSNFKENLENLASQVVGGASVEPPIFVLIDELDRCRPTYAIELLERVKHLFSLKDFVFILGTDTAQLSHAVRGVYGQGFDGARYLKRFIDRTYKFQPSSPEDFVKYQMERLGVKEEHFTLPRPYTASRFLSEVLSSGKRSLRDIEQIFYIIENFVAMWSTEDGPIDLITLFPLVYEMQSDVTDGDLENLLAGFIVTYRDYDKKSDVGVSLRNVVIASSESSGGNKSEARNDFHAWLFDKRFEERHKLARLFRGADNAHVVRDYYKDLLRKVTSIGQLNLNT